MYCSLFTSVYGGALKAVDEDSLIYRKEIPQDLDNSDDEADQHTYEDDGDVDVSVSDSEK